MPNQSKNPFFQFMLKYRREQESKGKKFNGGLKEVSNVAGPIWSAMTEEQREPYKLLANAAKHRDDILEHKFTSQGKSYAQLEREERARREKEERMIQEIEKTIQPFKTSSGKMLDYPFYFAHVNYYCQKDGTFYPCEIAVARFTLRAGIHDSMHSFIELDQIPPGYMYQAMKICDETHEIPLPPNKGERNYYRLLMNIKSFLKNGEQDVLPPLYTLPVHIDPVANVLEFLENCADYEIEAGTSFRVYPLTKLFFKLRHACAFCKGREGFPVETLAERELDKDMFNFTPGISCTYHETRDSMQYCSLSCVKRWCFLIADHCCQDVDVKLIPGSHVPSLSDVSGKLGPKLEAADNHNHLNNGAIPKTKPVPITIIDHSVSDSGRHSRLSGAGDMPHRNKTPSLPPLRQPNTMPQAIAGVLKNREAVFTAEDFPSIGGNGIIGKLPMAVAGRGRGLLRNDNQIPGAGRGQALEKTFASMTISKPSTEK